MANVQLVWICWSDFYHMESYREIRPENLHVPWMGTIQQYLDACCLDCQDHPLMELLHRSVQKKNKELAMWGVLKNYSFTVFDIRCEKQEHGTWNIQNLAWLWRPQCCCGVMIFTYNEVIRRVSKIPMVFPSSTCHPCRSPCGPTLAPDQLSQRWKAGSQLLWGWWLTTYFHIFLSMSIYLYLCLSLVRVEVVHDFHDWICMDLPWVGS